VPIDGWVIFDGLMGHDEAYSASPEEPHAWESETIEILADLLADYTLDSYGSGGSPGETSSPSGILTTKTFSSGSLAALLLPLQPWATRVDPQRVIRMSRREAGGLIEEWT